ncbi:DNA translocase FtsK [Lysinibacillus macroides]|uniref:Cell division protein n=1 Tax=Lysinibacillus macroides TaxID=33935 RepID=A0A0N0CV73_9BACI|nr:DNA translocase FtsK [Lysinibacillus macroides]KOY81351.1 cell division protein [Lysinibacillus macroides]QPR68479.1 DNA translocase FtsK [Lysinibacillus macroides]
MNWFKKQINKILNKEDDEYDYEEYYEDYEQEQQVQSEPPVAKQKTFRFPLIDDEEVMSQQPSQKEAFDYIEDDYYGQIEDLSLPKHLNHHIVDSRVYDVEVSGIRELLANRSKRTGRKTTMPRSQAVEQEKSSRASLVFRDAQQQPVQPQPSTPKETFQQPEKIVKSSLPENRKRFVPTDVPSPVYGFAKPSPIKELLDKRKEEYDKQAVNVQTSDRQETNPLLKEATTNKVNANILEEKESVSINQQAVVEQPTPLEKQEPPINEPIIFDDEVLEAVNDPQGHTEPDIAVPQTTAYAMDFEEPVQEDIVQEQTIQKLSADQSEIHVKEMVVEQVQIENSTIHIGEVTVVQPATNEKNDQQLSAEQSIAMTQRDEKSRIPFNVLMLKTDKEKWKIKQQSKMAQSSNTVENQQPSSNKVVDVKPVVDEKDTEDSVNIAASQLDVPQYKEPDHSITAVQLHEETNTNKLQPDNHQTVITMAPVTTMSNVATLEKAEMELASADEISATTELMIEPITEVVSATIEAPVQVEVVEQQEPRAVAVVEKTTKPVHVYQKPADEYLEPPEEKTQDTEWMEQQGDTLVEALSYFQVSAQIESIMQGPAVTQFEITVSHGTKVSKIRNLADDLKLALAAKDIRIQAPIPGKSSIGIEIPNRVSRAVRLSEVTNSAAFLESDSPLEAALGLDLTGKPVTLDLRKMPHGLIAGATGSGKSVCINSILVSLLYKAAPHELKLMLIDPKMVELAPFNHIPHLVSPVITDVKAATAALKWAVEEMERRYQLFAHAGARDITRYNAIADKNNEHSLKLPYILIVIDELADLMMMSPADVEEAICRIAQKARACGIHLIVATQRPSVDVITGLIKSNIPTRIAFAVSSQIDSRTILDGQGAERLLGRGDMLYLGNGMSAPVRLQGTFVTDDEIEAIIEHVREQGEPDYIFDQEELLKKTEVSAEQDDLFEDVCRFVYEQGGASTSLIQRKYHIGYNRAARLIDMLESHGFVSEARGSKPRESYITEEDLITMFE